MFLGHALTRNPMRWKVTKDGQYVFTFARQFHRDVGVFSPAAPAKRQLKVKVFPSSESTIAGCEFVQRTRSSRSTDGTESSANTTAALDGISQPVTLRQSCVSALHHGPGSP